MLCGRVRADGFNTPEQLAMAEAHVLTLLHRIREAQAEAARPSRADPALDEPTYGFSYNSGKAEPSTRENRVWALLLLKKLNSGLEDTAWGRSPAALWKDEALKEEPRFAELGRVRWQPPKVASELVGS